MNKQEVADLISLALNRNTSTLQCSVLEETDKAVVAIETDDGTMFFAEVIDA